MTPESPTLAPAVIRIADGARQMALDTACMELARHGRTLLRFYEWEPWCVSLGRNQPAGSLRERTLVPGSTLVRRPTGGRSVFHGPELTYAFTCPDRAWGGPRAVYRSVHACIAGALRSLGVILDGADTEGPTAGSALAPGLAVPCFHDPAPGEITVDGRKLVGSAQCRERRALLQHGSILLADRQTELHEESRSVGLQELIGQVEASPLAARLQSRFASAFSEDPNSAPMEVVTPDREQELSTLLPALERRYRSAEWTWRVP